MESHRLTSPIANIREVKSANPKPLIIEIIFPFVVVVKYTLELH